MSCQLSRLTVRNLRLYRRGIDEVGGAALPDHAAMRVLYSIEHRATVLRGVRDGSQAPKRDPPLP